MLPHIVFVDNNTLGFLNSIKRTSNIPSLSMERPHTSKYTSVRVNVPQTIHNLLSEPENKTVLTDYCV